VEFWNARFKVTLSRSRRAGGFVLASLLTILSCETLQNAVAEGDTRTLTFHHTHRGDDFTVTFKRNGRYDDEALKQLNYYLRDWRTDETTQMDPHLFDIVWEVYREVGGKEPVHIVSSYRSPQTNAMLRKRGRGVARFSQHMLGKAMDFFIPGVRLEEIRYAGLRLQRGGVGFYPTSGSPFVHLDTGNVRHWPRMTHDQLARVFPDGKTVHVGTDGQPLKNYALAMAGVQRRSANQSDTTTTSPSKRNFLAKLLGVGSDDEEDGEARATQPQAQPQLRVRAPERVAIAPPQVTPPAQEMAAVPMPRSRPQRTGEYSLASAATAPMSGPPPTSSGPTPSEIINARGMWAETPPPPRAEQPPRPPAPIAQQDNPGAVNGNGQRFAWLRGPEGKAPPTPTPRQRPPETATNVTWPDQADQNDRVPTELVLAYAANAGADPVVRPAYPMGSQRPNALIATKSPLPPANTARAGQRGDDPWLRGVVMAPSVQYSMSVSIFGGNDPRSIRAYMLKPRMSVHMVFSDDPQFGMAAERFTGAAVAFLPTISFIRTAGIVN
jgi:uncharacterized protein YcbK (DUF882 family)